MNTLDEEYPKQQARIRQCLLNGKEIGKAGIFYCLMAEDLLRRADKAAVEQDLPTMISIYNEMKEFKE